MISYQLDLASHPRATPFKCSFLPEFSMDTGTGSLFTVGPS